MDPELASKKAQERVLEELKELPTLSTVVAELMATLQEPTSSARDLERLIANDQAIAARLLKLANSAFYGLPGKVTSLTRAVTLLGFNTVRSLVLTIGVVNKFSGPSGSEYFDRGSFWEHSLAVAMASKLLAARDTSVSQEEAHIAGLLHDIGTVASDHCMPKKFKEAMRLIHEDGMEWLEAEKKAIGLSHDEVGALVAVHWRFPEFIREAIAYHHHPEEAQKCLAIVQVVHLANTIVRAFREQENQEEDYTIPELEPELKARWLPTPRDDEVFVTKYEVEIERVRDILKLFE